MNLKFWIKFYIIKKNKLLNSIPHLLGEEN